MREFKLFSVEDDAEKPYISVSAIHDERGYHTIREKLYAPYNLSNLEPNIQVFDVDVRGDRSLTLRYVPQNGISLADSKDKVMLHLHRLWKFDVKLGQLQDDGEPSVITRCIRQ